MMERQGWPKEPVPQVRVYRYDNADRIISLVQNDSFGEHEEEYRYDACGNLFDRKPCMANRLEEYGNTRYQYDAFGRLSRKWNTSQEQRFEYDADSRLVRVENVRGTLYTQVEMEYDLLGRRTLKRAQRRWTNAVEETTFRWAGMRLYGEQQANCPEVLFTYEEGSYAPLARVVGRGEKSRVQWFRNGLNGSPEALTDADGVIKWRQQWPAMLWGRERHESLTDGQGVSQNLRFQGQYLDRETGLHYNLFRYYDPECGRFTQPDPISIRGGINLYFYGPNPVNWIDPVGLAGKGKPPYSPTEDKWKKKGGSIDKSKGDGNWVYTDWEGNTVPYVNGHPDYSNGTNADGEKIFVRQSVEIENMECNYTTDYDKANAKAIEAKKPKMDDNIWHHHQDLKTMQEVDGKIHNRFTHIGGCSAAKAK
ncbi:HNH endonuclease [Salmonella enterica]|nr:HNH endonuclease [Salmonella enterica]